MIHTELPSDLNEVDVVIVGGGTTACVVASRLAAAEPSITVLVIERGPNNHNVATIIHPALYRTNFDQSGGTMLFYNGSQEAQLGNRSVAVRAGGVLGGGSSVNACVYGRAQRVDYDSWGVEGWSADDLIPYLKKFETYHPKGDDGSVHGSDGPMAVSGGTYNSESLRNDFIAAANQSGHKTVPDAQDLEEADAASPIYQYISPTTGRRQDSAHAYLHPQIEHGSGNLHVIVESQVSRVLFDEDKRASGVEFRNGGSTHTVKARKLVIISAGALGTPQILERSGVGSADVLGKAGVPVVADVPGVGHDYQDHQILVTIYDASLAMEDTVDSVVNGAMDLAQLLGTGAGILGWTGISAFSKLRPTQSEVDSFGPSFRKAWDRDFADNPKKPLCIIIPLSGILGDPTALPSGSYISMACFMTYPYSRGSVHITGPGLDDFLDFKTGYLTDPEDVDSQILAWMYKKQRQLAKKIPTCKEQIGGGPQFASGSKAHDSNLNPDSGEDIAYSAEDDEVISRWVKENVGTASHSMATCRMAPREKLGVVDGTLSVYGTKGLKLADLSIASENVSGNTMNTALLIGEKAADIFIKELGLSNSN